MLDSRHKEDDISMMSSMERLGSLRYTMEHGRDEDEEDHMTVFATGRFDAAAHDLATPLRARHAITITADEIVVDRARVERLRETLGDAINRLVNYGHGDDVTDLLGRLQRGDLTPLP
jgi:hypothetical protein